jgi:hypothetical protein
MSTLTRGLRQRLPRWLSPQEAAIIEKGTLYAAGGMRLGPAVEGRMEPSVAGLILTPIPWVR